MTRILSVDDQYENRYLLQVMLTSAGYEVHSAEDGVEALAKLEAAPFDLVISDILMPRMDGFQFCREVKRRPALRDIPFIFYSATYTEEEDRALGMDLGAAAFIVKPAEPEAFLAVIQEVLQRWQKGQMSVPPPPDATETEYLEAYNKRLIRKLEDKIAESEAVTRKLEAEVQAKHQEIAERRQVEAQLRWSESLLQIAGRMAHLGAWRVDLPADRVYWSDAVAALHGHPPGYSPTLEEAIGYYLPEYRDRIRSLFTTCLTEGSPYDAELEMLDHQGRRRWVRSIGEALRDEAGAIVAVHGAFQDITPFKRIEQEIRDLNASLDRKVALRTAQLEASNRELEAFAYSVSHDLKAPLRAIKGFTQAVAEDFGEGLPEEGRDLLQRVLDESTRMEGLILDLLRLARVGHQDMAPEPVDLSDLAEGLLRQYAAEDPHRRVCWEVEPGLSVQGDPILLRILLDNLLSNAWKFTGRRAEAHIRVRRCPASQQALTLCVEDDGTGFDPARADRLFAPFQRLHGAAEFPGTGIGLAIVRRIANRHGALVSAEGRPDAGATFRITFPSTGIGSTLSPR